jgi:hypothetical protein
MMASISRLSAMLREEWILTTAPENGLELARMLTTKGGGPQRSAAAYKSWFR